MWELNFEPQDIHSVGLWSQDFGKWIERRHEITDLGYKFWYRFTILPDDPVCKPKAPSVEEQLKQLEALANTDGSDCVFLFMDPLIKYKHIGEKNWKYNFSDASVDMIVRKAHQLGIKSITISLLDYYKHVEKRALKKGIEFKFLNPNDHSDQEEMIEIVQKIKNITDAYQIDIKSCCETYLHTKGVTRQGSCVDGNYLNKLFGPGASVQPDAGQRKQFGCGCTSAVDIGRYTEQGKWSHHCNHGCPQCYARR
jgi:DNA repair photolyase